MQTYNWNMNLLLHSKFWLTDTLSIWKQHSISVHNLFNTPHLCICEDSLERLTWRREKIHWRQNSRILVYDPTSREKQTNKQNSKNHNKPNNPKQTQNQTSKPTKQNLLPLLLLSSTKIISLSRWAGVRSMAEWMERRITERASLTKMNTMLTSGSLSGKVRFLHLKKKVKEKRVNYWKSQRQHKLFQWNLSPVIQMTIELL